jgi:hypothetical protein
LAQGKKGKQVVSLLMEDLFGRFPAFKLSLPQQSTSQLQSSIRRISHHVHISRSL